MKNIILETKIGSHIWSMNRDDSDIDLFKVFVVPTEDILKNIANTRSKFIQENNTDISLHEISVVVEQILKGNVNFLIGVMSPIIIETSEWHTKLKQIVVENISKNCYHSIHGLAIHNYKKYIEPGKDDSEKRCNKILRVLQFGKEILDTRPLVINGRMVFNVKFEFKSVSNGTPDDILAWIDMLNDAYKYSQLPEKSNEEPFRQFLLEIRKDNIGRI